MPPYKKSSKSVRSHDDSLLVVCAACWRKNKTVCRVSDRVADQIREHVYKDYSTKNSNHPKVICAGCQKTLSDLDKVWNTYLFVL